MMSKRRKKDNLYQQYYANNSNYSDEEDYTADFGNIDNPEVDYNQSTASCYIEESSSLRNEDSNSDNVCRDFVRNSCRRGRKCKFKHAVNSSFYQNYPISDSNNIINTQVQYEVNFCHDYQNNGCNRPQCKFIHCSRSEQEFYYATGILLPTIPCNNGNLQVPFCKDFLNIGCTRTKCKYVHLTKEEIEQQFSTLTGTNLETVNQQTNSGPTTTLLKTGTGATRAPPQCPPPPPPPPPPLPLTLQPSNTLGYYSSNMTNTQFTVSLPLISQPSITNLHYNPAILSCSGIAQQPRHSSNMITPSSVVTTMTKNNDEDSHQQQVVYGNIIHHHHAPPTAPTQAAPVCALISSENHHLSLPVVGTTTTTSTIAAAAAAHHHQHIITNHLPNPGTAAPSQSHTAQATVALATAQPQVTPQSQSVGVNQSSVPPPRPYATGPVGMSVISVATPCSILSASPTTAEMVHTIQQQQIRPYDQKESNKNVSNIELTMSDNSTLTPIYIQQSLPATSIPLAQQYHQMNSLESNTTTPHSLIIHNTGHVDKSPVITSIASTTSKLFIPKSTLTSASTASSSSAALCSSIPSSTTLSTTLTYITDDKSIETNAYQKLYEENEMLKKRLLDLETANEILLDQNARLRNLKSVVYSTSSSSLLTQNSVNNNSIISSQHHHPGTSSSLIVSSNKLTSPFSSPTSTYVTQTNHTSNEHSNNSEMATITLTVPLAQTINPVKSTINNNNNNNNVTTTNNDYNKQKSQLVNSTTNTESFNHTIHNNQHTNHKITNNKENDSKITPTLVTNAIQKIEKSVMPTLQALIGCMEDDNLNTQTTTMTTTTAANNYYNEDDVTDSVVGLKQKSREDEYDSNKLKKNQIDVEIPIRSSSCPSMSYSHSIDIHPTILSRLRTIQYTNPSTAQTCFQ